MPKTGLRRLIAFLMPAIGCCLVVLWWQAVRRPGLASHAATMTQLGANVAVDLGTVVLKEEDRHISILVGNPSDSALQVKDVRTSCGCAEAKISPDVIPAHGSAELKLRLSGATRGPKVLGVWLHTHSGEEMKLQVSATFIESYRWEPEKFTFGRIASGVEPVIQGLVEIVGTRNDSVPRGVVEPPEQIHIVSIDRVSGRTVGNQFIHQYRVSLRLRDQMQKTGDGFGLIRLLDDPGNVVAETTATWTHPKKVSAVPAQLAFVGTASQTRKLFLVSGDDREFSVTAANCTDDWLEIEASNEPSTRHEIRISLKSIDETREPEKRTAEVVLVTSSADVPEVRVPVRWTP